MWAKENLKNVVIQGGLHPEALLKTEEEMLKEAKQEAADLLTQANQRANQLVEDAKTTAQEEAERIKISAQNDVEQSTKRAREELRSEVAALAVAGAEKIINSEKVNSFQRVQILKTIAHKTNLLAKGFTKHKKINEAQFFEKTVT